MRKVLNASKVLGAIAFLAMIAAVGTAEVAIENGGPYWIPIVMVIILAVCAHLSIKEDGKIR